MPQPHERTALYRLYGHRAAKSLAVRAVTVATGEAAK